MSEDKTIEEQEKDTIDAEEAQETYENLRKEINRPFTSPDEAAMLIGNFMARSFLLAMRRWIRISANMKHRPSSTDFWEAYRDLVEGGSKTIQALKTAYSWEEAMRLLQEAKLRIKQLLAEKKISPEQAKQAEEELAVLGEKMRDASKA